MKLTPEQYNEMVEKLADEIIDNEISKEAAEETTVEDVVEAKKRALAEKAKEEAEQAEKEASEQEAIQALFEKSAAVYEYAINKIAACEEMYADGVLGQQACMETLAEVGLMDEYGINKEAAEESEESVAFFNKIADIYDDNMNKIASAEEKYAEALEELGAAQEVLASFGYEF